MRVNKEAASKIRGRAKKTLRNFVKSSRDTALVLPSVQIFCSEKMTQDYPTYAYVPYNQLWGNKEAIHKISIRVANNGLGIVNKKDANPELLKEIYQCLGEAKVENSKYDIITFRLWKDNSNIPTIDRTSFAFYKKNISLLRPFTCMDAYLPVTVFMAPDGQQWVDERNYIVYASNQNAVYQCSDGTLANSYDKFKDWECELAYHPRNPLCPTYSDSQETLETIGYLECSDGTIWRDSTLLGEYLEWKENKNYGMKDGLYVGMYGTCSSFEDYARFYNAAYYVNAGLSRGSQFCGAYGFLYSTEESAFISIDKLNGYQKVKNKEN